MGDKYLLEGNTALKRTTIFGFGKTAKYEDASAAFTKAGNSFKMSKQWTEAAEAFIKCAECQKFLDSDGDVTNSYVEAGSCYKKSDSPMDAVVPLELAITNYTERGRLGQVARYGACYLLSMNVVAAKDNDGMSMLILLSVLQMCVCCHGTPSYIYIYIYMSALVMQ